GMAYDELVYALKIGKPPAVASGRSQYGLGMKTAACWLGNIWTIRTKKLGDPQEHTVTVDVEKVASGDLNLDYRQTAKPADLHYTTIEIQQLHMKLQGRRLGKIKDFLKSMYRVDIREGLLDLYWQDSILDWPDDLIYLTARDGTRYRKNFEFEVEGKRVHGLVGILGEGSSGRPNAGFAMLRRGRVIKGHPGQWRPESIFGWDGRNDLINQRITGEIHFDEFDISHTKDDIQWLGTQEDEVQEKLKQVCQDYVARARDYRVKDVSTRGPSAAEVKTAVDTLENEMRSPEFVDRIELGEVPPPEIIAEIE
ncbi:ATP-binding protein, partial [Rhodoplanes sp. SY1]|uniref:ATP-binding protein n=1 Tax=Rhodoplanes sp. SY1 TaxID=3166646 RepID=UPI0038B5625E